MLDLQPKHREIVLQLLNEHLPAYQGFAFGSRVQGRAGRFSDLDVALVGPGPIRPVRLNALREAFSLSNLPIFVDLIDMQAVPEEWRDRIARQIVPL